MRGSHEWLSTRASPLDSTELTTGDIRLKVCYSRPRARGRAVFDSVAPFGKVWRTGANEPTTLLLATAADIAGVRLSAGRYVILSVPGAQQWTILFHTTQETDPARMFQSLVPVGQGTAVAEPLAEPADTFTIAPHASPTGAELQLIWHTLRVRIPVRAVP